MALVTLPDILVKAHWSGGGDSHQQDVMLLELLGLALLADPAV
jgi:hypothetical protein